MKVFNSLKFSVTAKFIVIVAILCGLILVVVPLRSQDFFIEETYRTIEELQSGDVQFSSSQLIDPRRVNHIILTENYMIEFPDVNLLPGFLDSVIENIDKLKSENGRFIYRTSQDTIYYVIKDLPGDTGYLISFVYFNYINNYAKAMFNQLLSVMLVVVSIAVLLAIYFASSIADPLVVISKRIKNISVSNWDEEVPVTRNDEIGLIEHSLEEMRQHLKMRSKIQQEMFQNISHDLKTPIMIIEGYTQSIIDGYIEADDLKDTALSILEEAKRLENKVKSLLYINKLDQLYTDKVSFAEIDAAKLFETVVNPFKTRFPNLHFEIRQSTNEPLKGEFDDWRVALENIVDNMTRFAKENIIISYDKSKIILFNDGEPIHEDLLETIFTAYGVGNRPNFGLGLAITKKVLSYFGYTIRAENAKNGVLFIIEKMQN